jgi:hypothetical protein
MTLEEFKQSKSGQRLAPLLSDPATVARMEAMTREGRPAVKAIDEAVAAEVGELSNVERQHVGRWVRDVLGRRGLRPVRQVEWRGGRAFSSGAVYAPVPPVVPVGAQPEGSPAERIARAREILLAGRRDGTKPLGTVDDFLGARRAMWGKG